MRIPPGPEALTPAWLTQVLRASGTIGGETQVASFRFLNPEGGPGIAGQHARLGLTYDRGSENAPATMFAKFSMTDPEVRKVLHGYKVYVREVKFYGELANRVPPRTLFHYDCHLDNLFFRTTNDGDLSVAVIDWQLYFIGRGVYDVAYFLAGNLAPDTRRSCEMRLLRLYHELLLEGGVRGYPFEDLLADYRLFLLEGLFRVVWNAVYINLSPEQERAHLEVYAARFLSAVHDHDSLALMPA